MATGSLPHSVQIDNTSATNGGQAFAGVNHGTIHFASNGNETYTPAKDELLNSLPTAKDAPFNAYQRQHEATCLPATRIDLLRDIHDWADAEDSPCIFWLSGLAGTGKSIIAQTVAVDYHAKGRLAASFFFSRAGGDVNHAGKFITSVAYQMAKTISGLKPKICDAISKDKDIASQSLDDQWQELVLGPLSSLQDEKNRPKYVIVVDALDECDDQNNVQVIVQRLAELQSLQGTRLRVLLTSRPEVPIQNGFTQVRRDEHQDFVLHDIEPAIIEHDISVFLSYQLGLIGKRCGLKSDWPEESVILTLVQKSGGLFIWAATACRYFEEDSELTIIRVDSLVQGDNSMLPPERKLDEIYTTVLTNSVRAGYTNEENQILQERFRQVVGPIIVLQDTLSIASLAGLLGKDIEIVRRSLTKLRSVLSVPAVESNAIRLLHPSFRDFLLDPRRCLEPQFHIDEQLVHREIYKRCLQVISKHLRRDVCNLQHPAARITNLSRAKVDQHIQPHIQYACRFWIYHFLRSDIDISSCYSIEKFFQKHFLYWLEALALLGCVSDAVDGIYSLDAMFSNDRREPSRIQLGLLDRIKSTVLSSLSTTNRTLAARYDPGRFDIQDIVHDATHFISHFRPILEEAPLQVYYAGLMFSPNTSTIKKTFLSELKDYLSYIPDMEEDWNPCMQTIIGHSSAVNALVFSPDSKTLASVSWDWTVKLWDAGSGKMLQTLRDHSSLVIAVAFSPDGKTLASASRDGAVKLWDAGSGRTLRTLEGHSNEVTAGAFSLNGKTLASALHNRTVNLWDVGSGKTLRTLKGHSNKVTAVAFSSDGKTLASASFDGKVKLWDAGSGKALQTLKGHSIEVSVVAFSPDGKKLASASRDETVKLWDTSSGKVLQTLKGQTNGFLAVTFSPDGKTLASVTMNGAVTLWDAGSGKALQALKGHIGGVTAIAFSPDGKTLASAAWDETVKLWNAGSGKTRQPLEGHSDQVKAMVFSPDGKTLASASTDRTVKLWDASTGKMLRTLKGHSDIPIVVAFSPDSKTLASASWEIVKLWDAGSGKVLQTLKGHSSIVSAVAFSPDGKMLMSASRDETVKLWDAGSGKVLQTIKGYSDIKSLSFSSAGISLRTNEGMLLTLDSPLCTAHSQPGPQPSISVKEEWIYWNCKPILWLPSEYRPDHVAVHENKVGFGYTSGFVLIFQLIF